MRVRSYQRIGIFLDRRFSPAIATCNAVMSRIESLAQRAERANNLLRTRVDIALEAQNQSLLRSMDARARQQLAEPRGHAVRHGRRSLPLTLAFACFRTFDTAY